jgi:hypothetical protein
LSAGWQAASSSNCPVFEKVEGDSSMAEQELLNLAVNARDAMPGGVSGAQLAERLKIEKHNWRVIYMSGYCAGMGTGNVGANHTPRVCLLHAPDRST